MYGCAVMAASTLTRRALAVMGALLAVLGVIALQVPVSLPERRPGRRVRRPAPAVWYPDRRTSREVSP